MSLLSLALLNLTRKKTLESFETFFEGDIDKMLLNNIYTMVYMVLLLLVTTIPAVLVAINCNKDRPIIFGIIAFVFSDIYLLQWSIKKFVIKYPDYCPL